MKTAITILIAILVILILLYSLPEFAKFLESRHLDNLDQGYLAKMNRSGTAGSDGDNKIDSDYTIIDADKLDECASGTMRITADEGSTGNWLFDTLIGWRPKTEITELMKCPEGTIISAPSGAESGGGNKTDAQGVVEGSSASVSSALSVEELVGIMAERYGISQAQLQRIMFCESTNGLLSDNLYQFGTSTWQDLLKKRGIKIGRIDDFALNIELAAWSISQGGLWRWQSSFSCWNK